MSGSEQRRPDLLAGQVVVVTGDGGGGGQAAASQEHASKTAKAQPRVGAIAMRIEYSCDSEGQALTRVGAPVSNRQYLVNGMPAVSSLPASALLRIG